MLFGRTPQQFGGRQGREHGVDGMGVPSWYRNSSKTVLFGAASRRLLSGGRRLSDSLQLCRDTQNRNDVNCSRIPSNFPFTSPFAIMPAEHPRSSQRAFSLRERGLIRSCRILAFCGDLCCKIEDSRQITTQVLTARVFSPRIVSN